MNNKNVYILGAGFSRNMGLPLLNNFFQEALNVLDTSKYEKILAYRRKLLEVRNYLSFDLWNLEQVFSLLEMERYLSDDENHLKEEREELINLIADLFKKLLKSPFLQELDSFNESKLHSDTFAYSLYTNFLFFLNNEDTIISFNYDLIIELAICLFDREKKRTNIKYCVDYGIKNNAIKISELENFCENNLYDKKPYAKSHYLFEENKKQRKDICKINLLKLHGSLNWSLNDNSSPVIVPPTWDKSDYNHKDLVQPIWKKAYDELILAKNIIFIGYSLPETDMYFKNLFGLALKESESLEGIYIINPDKKDVKKRYEILIDKHFENYYKYYEWYFDNDFFDSKQEKGKESIKFFERICGKEYLEDVGIEIIHF